MVTFLFVFLLNASDAKEIQAKEIITNEVILSDAPSWLTRAHVQRIIDRIQHKLEWSTKKTAVHWYSTDESFQKAQNLGAQALAVTLTSGDTATIHLGPRVNRENFDTVFGHEMVHVIVFQKYKKAIPKWLEEGLANHLSNSRKVDYKWLSQKPLPEDVRKLDHPFSGSAAGVIYRYKASQAFAEMLDRKCHLDNLIRLSVERNMEDYIASYCQIKDLNLAFRDWVKKQSASIN